MSYTYYVIIFTEQQGYKVKPLLSEDEKPLATNPADAIKRMLAHKKRVIMELEKDVKKLEMLQYIEGVKQVDWTL